MLITSSTKSAEPRKGVVGVGGDSRARHGGGELDGSWMNNIEVDGGEVEDDKVVKKGRNLSKSKKTDLDFLISGARKAFTKLKQVFIKAPILYHFDPKRHIRVETDASGYTIVGVLS